MSPYRPKVSCKFPGCPELLDDPGYCPKHKAFMGYASDQWHHLYNNSRWRKYRNNYLAKHPLCVQCKSEGKVRPSAIVDHIVQHRGDHKLFWSPDNHQALCKAHHSEKTARETGFMV